MKGGSLGGLVGVRDAALFNAGSWDVAQQDHTSVSVAHLAEGGYRTLVAMVTVGANKVCVKVKNVPDMRGRAPAALEGPGTK